MSLVHTLLTAHRNGQPVGLYSVCSSQQQVLVAAMQVAQTYATPLLVEATSNQVDQFGGYTGMTPPQFRAYVEQLADAHGFPRARLILGGDHLGPNAWQSLPAATAMAHARDLIHAYVSAGFHKIHLDCSMACAGDPLPLPDAIVAARSAELAGIAEASARAAGLPPPVYVIGTEVPVPGGASEAIEGLAVTTAEAALTTIYAHRFAFIEAGLDAAWTRVIASVVQPGVEFDHHNVIAYAPANAQTLSAAIAGQPGMVFEAHSTDYQTRTALQALVRDHFAILKVGPGLTFALREALWALDAIEREWIADTQRAHLRATTLTRLHAEPKYWQRYYHAQGEQLHIDLQYSLSDRIRYYWPDTAIERARLQLFDTLRSNPPPLALIGQYLPHALLALREGRISNTPDALVMAHIDTVLDDYLHACQ